MKRSNSIAVGLLILAIAGTASATSIDFRSPDFGPGAGQVHHSVLYAGYSFSLDALNIADMGHDGSLHWDRHDGFGISGSGWEGDEIELPEVLRLSFGETLYLESLVVTDLYVEGSGPHAERGFYSLDDGSSWHEFLADGVHHNGQLTVLVNDTADSVLLTSPGREPGPPSRRHEFSLAGVDVQRPPAVAPVVPEPSTALLYALSVFSVARRIRVA